MSEYITQWNSLETYGSKGKAFKTRKDYLAPTGRFALRYASIIGTAFTVGFAIYNYAMAVA